MNNIDAQLGDLHILETADGEKLYLDKSEVGFLVYGGYGAPPINYQTRKGYKQHGATEVDYTLEIRAVTVVMWRKAACSRQEYWDMRGELHNILRPNRGGPLTLTLRTPNGDERSLLVRANPGLQFPMPSIDENSWQIEETLEFTAFDPVWFDPNIHTEIITGDVGTDLVFPIDFPISFTTAGAVFELNVDYPGTWKAYPVITIRGPYTTATIENVTTGVQVYLNIAVGSNEYRIIDFTPGSQSILDADGVNKFGELGADSNLVDFNIRPDPEVPGGTQTIRVVLNGGVVGTSEVTIEYYDRYYAL